MDDAAMRQILTGDRAVIVYDLEGTCWKGVWSRRKETIEIGAVAYRHGEGITADFQTYVKPVAVPRIATFCTELTGITQDDVDAAPEFPRAMLAFLSWAKEHGDYVRAGWGAYEQWQFELDLELHELPPLADAYLDIKKLYARLGRSKDKSIDAARDALGIEAGEKHRALDDARVAARILQKILGG